MSDVSQPGGGRQTPNVVFKNAPTDRTERASARSDLSGPPAIVSPVKMPAPGIMPAPAAAPSTSNPLRVRAAADADATGCCDHVVRVGKESAVMAGEDDTADGVGGGGVGNAAEGCDITPMVLGLVMADDG